jgi:methanogenic corrinoid protein MtbC1
MIHQSAVSAASSDSQGSFNPDLTQSYLQPLLAGDRTACRGVIAKSLEVGISPVEILTKLIWPTMEVVQGLYRQDRINISSLNLATRLNRAMADQVGAQLTAKSPHGRKALVFCGNAEPEELGGQICADLFECEGWTVRFAGGGVPDDEVLNLIGDFRPDLLIMFGTLAAGVPAVRKLIDYLREVNCCPAMQVMCCGGIYKRAEGLADEIGADLYAPDAMTAVEVAKANPTRKATVDQQTVGRTRRLRKAAARRGEPTRPVRIAPGAAAILADAPSFESAGDDSDSNDDQDDNDSEESDE